MAFIFGNDDFLTTVEAKDIIIARYVQLNETMAIKEFQRSRLTFDLSAKVGHIKVPSIFSKTIRPIEFNFHMKTPYDKLAKICTNVFWHMTKMADIPIYGINPFKNHLLQNQKAVDLGA